MNHLFVWITVPTGETVLLGELAFDDMRPDGTALTAFRYAREWLSRPEAFPINPDPQVLPLEAREFQASNLGFPLRVFDDALPDEWGRRLIVALERIPLRQQGPYWIMKKVGATGIGALSFSTRAQAPTRPNSSRALTELAEAAVAFDAGEPVADLSMRRLYAAGASAGGARPKALVAHDSSEWLAKFPSPRRDLGLDVVGLEATCLALAGCAGLDVPAFELVNLGVRRAVLVRRFDIAPEGGRLHMISLATLCRETGGTFVTTYNVPADTIRRLSDDSDDVDRFFRQMVFNAAIGNTDDHLRNFIMLRSTRGYHLSPAFDLVPDISGDRDHQMAIGYSHSTPTGTDLMSVGKQWIANLTRVRSIVDDVIGAVHQFRATAEALEVDDATIQKFDQDIRWRLQILAKGL